MPHHNFFQHHIPSTLQQQHQTTSGSHFAKSKSYNPYKHHNNSVTTAGGGQGASTIMVNQPVRSYHFGHPSTSFVKPGPSSAGGPIKSQHNLQHHQPNIESQKGIVHHGIRLVGLAPPSAPHLPRS